MQFFGRMFRKRILALEGRAEELRGRVNVKRGKVTRRIVGGVQRASGAVRGKLPI
jgi:hypothetical protein